MPCKPQDLHCENAKKMLGQTLEPAHAEALALLFKAMSEPVRLRILSCLMMGELCVHDMSLLLGLSQPAVSNQLRHLRLHKLVKCRKAGNHVFYSLDDEHVEAMYHMGLDHYNHTKN